MTHVNAEKQRVIGLSRLGDGSSVSVAVSNRLVARKGDGADRLALLATKRERLVGDTRAGRS